MSTALYLELLSISNKNLLARSVIQTSYRIGYENTVESL